ncbi:MAG: CHRD domain-containing protein [Vicinamibacterales bacterium]
MPRIGALAWLLMMTGAALSAQARPTLRARLSPVPIDVAMQATIAGLGDATATLSGSTLTVEGRYRGLVTPATSVRVYDSARQGMRGTLVGEFASGGGTTGSFTGTVTLTPAQADAFAKGLLYVQVQSEKAPDGNLRGWLMPTKGSR